MRRLVSQILTNPYFIQICIAYSPNYGSFILYMKLPINISADIIVLEFYLCQYVKSFLVLFSEDLRTVEAVNQDIRCVFFSPTFAFDTVQHLNLWLKEW